MIIAEPVRQVFAPRCAVTCFVISVDPGRDRPLVPQPADAALHGSAARRVGEKAFCVSASCHHGSDAPHCEVRPWPRRGLDLCWTLSSQLRQPVMALVGRRLPEGACPPPCRRRGRGGGGGRVWNVCAKRPLLRTVAARQRSKASPGSRAAALSRGPDRLRLPCSDGIRNTPERLQPAAICVKKGPIVSLGKL